MVFNLSLWNSYQILIVIVYNTVWTVSSADKERTKDFECVQEGIIGMVVETRIANSLDNIASPAAQDDAKQVAKGRSTNEPNRARKEGGVGSGGGGDMHMAYAQFVTVTGLNHRYYN